MPSVGVYFVWPRRRASMAAAFTCSGVSKSGSPAVRLTTSIPSAAIALARAASARVADGLTAAVRRASRIGLLAVGQAGAGVHAVLDPEHRREDGHPHRHAVRRLVE